MKRNATEIKVWMLRKGVKEADIVRATRQEQTYVNKTINGHKHNRTVLRYLLDNGCPRKLLALPRDMTEEQQ
jgi:hypothetical protein